MPDFCSNRYWVIPLSASKFIILFATASFTVTVSPPDYANTYVAIIINEIQSNVNTLFAPIKTTHTLLIGAWKNVQKRVCKIDSTVLLFSVTRAKIISDSQINPRVSIVITNHFCACDDG